MPSYSKKPQNDRRGARPVKGDVLAQARQNVARQYITGGRNRMSAPETPYAPKTPQSRPGVPPWAYQQPPSMPVANPTPPFDTGQFGGINPGGMYNVPPQGGAGKPPMYYDPPNRPMKPAVPQFPNQPYGPIRTEPPQIPPGGFGGSGFAGGPMGGAPVNSLPAPLPYAPISMTPPSIPQGGFQYTPGMRFGGTLSPPMQSDRPPFDPRNGGGFSQGGSWM